MARPRPTFPWIDALPDSRTPPTQATVLQELRSVILAGSARPGSLIPVDDVAARFAVSRIPVREALKTLVGEDLVEHEPRGGYRVAQLTRAELAEMYVVRACLETAALTAAVPQAGHDDDAAAGAALSALQEATAAGDTGGHHRWSRAFHLALVAPCAMPRLLRMLGAAWNITEPERPMSHASPEATAALAGDHAVILAAFVSRDVATLLATTADHYARLQEVVAAIPE